MRVSVMLVSMLLAAPARADLGPCDKLLEQGIRSYLGASARKDFSRPAYGSICSTFEAASKDATGAAARRAWEMVGGEGEWARARFDRLKMAYCTLGKLFSANVSLYRTTARALRPDALAAWKRCTDAVNGKYGPPMEVEQIDDYALSVALRPVAHDVRSVRITMQGFERCSGFVRVPDPRGAPARFEIPLLARNAEHDLSCFRKVARKPPCETEAVPPASLTLELEYGSRAKVQHRFEMGRIMSPECPLPASP